MYTGNGRPPSPPGDDVMSVLTAALEGWRDDEQGPQKLVVPLEHMYTSQSLSFPMLKSRDKVAANMLINATKQNGGLVMVYLAMLDHHESSYDTSGMGCGGGRVNYKMCD